MAALSAFGLSNTAATTLHRTERAFAEIGVTLRWKGNGADEVGVCEKTKRVLVRVDPRYFRPTEVDSLLGNPEKARRKLGWNHRVGFAELVKEMVQSDLTLARSGAPHRS